MNLDDEIGDHIERETQENIERGMPAEEARNAALRKFGNITRVKEDTREVWRHAWLDQLLQDVHYAGRMLRRDPGFAAVVILTLALGIGMTTAIFSVVNAALLRPLDYPHAERLVWLASHEPNIKRDWAQLSDFYQWRAETKSYTVMAAYGYQEATLAPSADGHRVSGVLIGGDFWAITGARAALGRLPAPDEQGAIVISWDLFRQQFAANPHIVGSSISLDGRPAIIAAVLPKTFRFQFPAWWQATDPHPIDLYAPFPPVAALGGRNGQVVAALKPGISPARAQAELQTLEKHILEVPANPPRYLPSIPRVEPLQQTITRAARPALLLLLTAGVFVLLIAAVNIANLQLSRATVREREIAIRAAIGAGRMRVVRQLLVESMVLALAGGAAGLLVARGAIAILIRLSSYAIPRLVETSMDGRVLAFTLVVSIATGLLFGAGPALALRRINLNDALKAGARSSAGLDGMRFRKLLVAGELALAMVLLASAGLMLKSFWRMSQHPPGFAPEKVLVMKLRLAGPQYAAKPALERYLREMLRRLDEAPGVKAAGVGNWVILVGVHGLPNDPSPTQAHALRITFSSPRYLKAFGARLLKGRWLTDGDTGKARILMNESMAREAFGKADPVGRKLSVPQPDTVVVGLVADLQYSQLDQAPPAEIYADLDRFLQQLRTATVAVRTTRDPLTLAPALRKLISGIDPTQPVYNIETLEQSLADSVAPRRFNLFLLGSFAAAALLLAIVGIYGAIAYSVVQRTREIGVRLALGAERGRVVRMVVREGMSVALVGILAGLAASLALAPAIAKLLYEVKANDPWTLAAVTLSLAATALAACCAPARKAAWIDPAITLRYE
jgi:predicted permease